MASGGSGLPLTGVELVAANLQGFLGSLKTGNTAVDTFGKGMDTASRRTSAASEIMIGVLRRVGEIALDTFVKAGRALVGFGQDSLRLAGDFQSGMQQFQVAAGQDLDASGLEEFHDLFLKLGKELPVSTAAVQQAATEMVKGGLDPAILAAGGLKNNIQFAAAAMGGDLVGAAEISAKIVAGWATVGATAAEKAELLAHSQDLLTKAANASSVNVHELSLGLFNVQATAKNAGMDLDGVTTVLAELAGDFASSSEAGNSMASFINRLHPTTKDATAAMMSLGLVTEDGANAFYTAEGNFIGWAEASEVLKQSMAGLNNEQRQQIMQTIFQKDAMGVAAGLAARGAEGYNAMAASLQNAMGVTQAGQTIQAGYNTALENAMGSVEALKITIGEAFLPILTDLINNVAGPALSGMIEFAGAFANMIPAILASEDPLQTFLNALKVAAPNALEFITGLETFKDNIVALQAPVEAFGTLLMENLPIIEGIAVALGSFVILTTVVGWITGAVAAVTAFGAAFTAAGGGIAGVVALLGGPVTIAIGAVALAVGLLTVAWQNNWGDIQGKTAAAWTVIRPVLNTVVDWLQVNIPKAIAVAADYWTTTLWPALQKVGSFIETNIFPVMDTLINVWLKLAGAEVQLLGALWTNVLWPALQVVGSFIGNVLWPIFQKLFEVEFAIAMKVGEALAGLWQKVLWPALKNVGSYISDTIIPTFQKIGSYLSTTFGPVLESITTWLGKVTGGFTGISSAVTSVTGFLGGLADKISTLQLPSWLTPGSPTPFEIALLGIGTAIQSSVVPGLGEMARGMRETGEQITEAFVNTDIVDMLENLGKDAMAGFGDGLRAGMRKVEEIIDNTANTIEDAFNNAFDSGSPSKRMIPVGQFIVQGVMEGMQSQAEALTDLVGSIGDGLTSQMEDIAAGMGDLVADGFDATASIDRQMAKNLDKFKDVLPEYEQYTQGALYEAQQKALEFQDPSQGAKYFKMRSDQILEYAKLQKDLSEAETEEDKKRIQQQMALINAAQTAELNAWEAKKASSPVDNMVAQIDAIMRAISEIALTEDQIKIVDMLSGLWYGLQTLPEYERPQYDPGMTFSPMSASQYGGTTTSNSYSQQSTYNMPIYTNNSSSALQQSLAIMQASQV